MLVVGRSFLDIAQSFQDTKRSGEAFVLHRQHLHPAPTTRYKAMKYKPNTSLIDLDMACIPSNYSRLIARELGLQIRDLPSFLGGESLASGVIGTASLSVEQFLNEDTLLTPRQQIQLLEKSLKMTEDQTFGLRLGKRFTSPTHGAIGFLANSSPNLLMMMQALQLFLPTRMNLARLNLRTRGDWLEVDCTFDQMIKGDVLRIMSEILAVIFADLAEFIVGRPVHEIHIDFSHPAPLYRDRYADFLPGTVKFSSPHIRVRLLKSVCEIPNASANHENYQMALQQCEAILAQLKANNDSCKYQIQKMMLSGPPGILGEEDAAAALFVSKRTLARRLKKEGTQFRQIRDEILSQQAAGYLRNSSLSIDAIAALFNYHDSSNFRRAFKRWFELTPDQYRQQR